MTYRQGRLLTTIEAAAVLNMHPSTLEKGRQDFRRDAFPPFIRIGRAVRYREEDLLAWLDRRVVHVGGDLA